MSSEAPDAVAPTAPADPLAELRRADARPALVQLRERLAASLQPSWSMGASTLALAAACACVAVLVGWRLVVDSQPPVEASLPFAQPEPTTTPPEPSAPVPGVVVVHVAGAVARPGLVIGETDWRVADAVAAAGGSSAGADLDRVNLAAPLRDGERIYIPSDGEAVPAVAGSNRSGMVETPPSGPIDLNTADAAALETLPGIGPATAGAILAHRDEHGPFGTIDGLVAVRGIGPATLDSLRDHVVVG